MAIQASWQIALCAALLAPHTMMVVVSAPQRGDKLAYSISPGAQLLRVEEDGGDTQLHQVQADIKAQDEQVQMVAEVDEAGETIMRRHASTPDRPRQRMVRAEGSAGAKAAGAVLAVSELLASESASGNAIKTIPDFQCGTMISAVRVAEGANCSKACPYWAESAKKELACHFECVKQELCGDSRSGLINAPIPDGMGYCRRCSLLACLQCQAHTETCVLCKDGFHLHDGICMSDWARARYFTYFLLGSMLVYFVLWYLEIRMRPVINEEGLQQGVRLRARSKLRQKSRRAAAAGSDSGSGASPMGALAGAVSQARRLFSLKTNLLRDPVAGPGGVLHFRFQCAWLLWPLFGMLLWALFAHGYDPSLLDLGMREATTPLDLCRAVAWGHELQKNSRTTKATFAFIFYLFSVVGTIIFGVKQQNQHNELDTETTMKDYAVYVSGLPVLKGTEKVEEELSEFLKGVTGQHLEGVSVAWDMTDNADHVKDVLEEDLCSAEGIAERDLQGDTRIPPTAASADRPLSCMEENGLRWKLFGLMDKLLLNVLSVPEARLTPDTEKLLNSMETTPYAFAVFSNEESRDDAVKKFNETKPQPTFKGCTLQISIRDAEPESVRWDYMGMTTLGRPWRLIKGSLMILLAMLIWLLVFYLPYVAYMSTLQYDAQHQEPSGGVAMIMTLVVTAGNMFLYFVCSAVSETIGFHFEEDREAAYMFYYTAAILINVVLDLGVAAWTSYEVMVGSGAHTFGGLYLSELKSYKHIFESYPIQKGLGNQLWAYNFPATFLLPFLIEPLAVVYLPYHFMTLVVRSNPSLKGWRGEKAMAFLAPMDTGRYADIIVNLMLASLVFFVPAGWIMPTFGSLFVSSAYIYLYDHYRVLRCVPSFYYASTTIDKVAQWLSVIPCGFILVSVVYKLNCATGHFCLDGDHSVMLYLEVFAGHCLVHLILLVFLVPKFHHKEDTRSEVPYVDTAKITAATWFNTNPTFCYRSKFLYKHNPPVMLFERGKEHLQKANPKIGQHFEDLPADEES